MRTRVYVAGPISGGSLQDNLKQARAAGQALLLAGYAPLVPHLSCYWAGDVPEVLPSGTTQLDWYAMDLPWVVVADALLRLPGESRGADLEERWARRCDIPVYRSLEQLLAEVPPCSRTSDVALLSEL